MGCGRGNIWVRNWSKIPRGATITLVDKRRSAIEYLESFYQKNQRFMHSTHNSYGFMEKVQQLFEKAGIAIDLNKRIQQQAKERTQLENYMKNCFTQVNCAVFENRIIGIRQADAILRYVQSQDLQLYIDYCEDWKEYEHKINQELKEGVIFVL